MTTFKVGNPDGISVGNEIFTVGRGPHPDRQRARPTTPRPTAACASCRPPRRATAPRPATWGSGTCTYTADGTATTDSFTYTVGDGTGQTAVGTVRRHHRRRQPATGHRRRRHRDRRRGIVVLLLLHRERPRRGRSSRRCGPRPAATAAPTSRPSPTRAPTPPPSRSPTTAARRRRRTSASPWSTSRRPSATAAPTAGGCAAGRSA